MSSPKYSDRIIKYGTEVMLVLERVKEINKIAHLIHRSGMFGDNSVQMLIDNYEVFAIHDWEETIKMYMNNDTFSSGTSDYTVKNDCSLVKYLPSSQTINFCTDIVTIDDAYNRFEELYFQHSTVNHQCALDGFEMIMYLTEMGADIPFLLTTPMDIDIISEFNKNLEIIVSDIYERTGVPRVC